MLVIERPDRILYHLEAIDIENDEYLFWDATGVPVKVTILKNKVADVSECAPKLPLRDAFVSYLETLDLPPTLAAGAPTEVWNRIQQELEKRPKKSSWFAKLFTR